MPVKLQVVNLAVKMYLPNPPQTKLISQYVFNLAKFDQNYDLRDRARFIRAILFPQGEPGKKMKSKHAKKKYLAPKSLPTIESKFFNRDEYQLGSLSHFINARVTGKVQAKLAWLDSWSRRIFKVNKLGNLLLVRKRLYKKKYFAFSCLL